MSLLSMSDIAGVSGPGPGVTGATGGVELQVTNLDSGIDQREVKQLVTSLFNECVTVTSVQVYRMEGGSVGVIVKVPSMQEAQLAISQLHKRKVGTKRIAISHLPSEDAVLPRTEVYSLLKGFPGSKVQLFKFRQLFEERFRCSISVAELHKMKDLVSLTEEVPGQGRMVQLHSTAVMESEEVEDLYCLTHYPLQLGWGEKRVWEGLPDVVVGLEQLTINIIKMLAAHQGSVPLASLLYCYNAECEQLVTVATDDGRHGVPLEHLLQAVKGVVIVTVKAGIKKLMEATPANCIVNMSHLVGPPPALAGAMITFTREVVELLKALPGCKVPFFKFIPKYHHYFGKQCRVADYGYTKLRDLLESMPNVVQIIGEGTKTIITLSHKAQVRRFTNDIQKMLKNQPDKHILLSEFPKLYEETFLKSFSIYDYGLCELTDLFKELPESTIVLEEIVDEFQNTKDHLITVFKRFQTPEEIIRTRGFAKEVVELLRHAPDLSISFNKFIPAYHQHFGRQCRVGSYGLTKLIELFEAIPDTVDLAEDGDERVVQLSRDKMIWVIGEQLEGVVKASRAKSIPVGDIEAEFKNTLGHSIPMEKLGVFNVESLVELLQSWVRTVETKEGTVVVTVDRGFIRTLASNIRKLLIEQPSGSMDLLEFVHSMANRFGCHVELEMLRRDLSYLVEVKETEISLTPLQLCSRDIELVLGEVGRLPVAELEYQYEAKLGRELPLEPLGFESVSELLSAMNDTLTVKGRGVRKIVSISKSPSSAVSPSRPSSSVLPQLLCPQSRPAPLAAFSGRGFDMIRSVGPHSTARTYSGVLQAGVTEVGDLNMNHHKTQPPPSLNITSAGPRFNLPPPSYLQAHPPPPLVGSPKSSFIPLAAPNSPLTPTTPRAGHYQWPSVFPVLPPHNMAESPMATSPVTFHQHLLHLSPSPLITPSPSSHSPFIVQPIARNSLSPHQPELGHLGMGIRRTEELANSFKNVMDFSNNHMG